MEESTHDPPKQRSRETDAVIASLAWVTFYYLLFGFTYAPLSIPIMAPLWLAIAFGCFAYLRRQFTMRVLFAFVTVEAASVALAVWCAGWMGMAS